jgi:hypothetical protein
MSEVPLHGDFITDDEFEWVPGTGQKVRVSGFGCSG